MKAIVLSTLLFLTFSVFSQEDSLRVIVNHTVIEPTIRNPYSKVESYIDVNDSIDLFINAIQKRFGEVEEVNGVYNWSGISIDSIGKGIKIKMIHGLWITKKSSIEFIPCPPKKVGKLKKNEKRGVRIRVFLKDGKDALIGKSYESAIVQIIEELLNSSPKEITE